MDEFVHIPHDWLTPKVLNDPQMLKMVVYIASEISKKGEITISAGQVQKMFGISRQRFREFLKKTKSQPSRNQVATNIVFKNQVFTPIQQPSRNQVATRSQPSQKRKQTNKFTPPTEQEVRDYVTEKRYHFNPESFLPYYEKQGWKQANGQLIKDWKAACRYWEIRWKEKHGEKFYYQIGLPQQSSGRGQHRNPTTLDLAREILGDASC